ncbi:hypothetical protein V6Z11_A03G077200 [Gossypium hirsutum]
MAYSHGKVQLCMEKLLVGDSAKASRSFNVWAL